MIQQGTPLEPEQRVATFVAVSVITLLLGFYGLAMEVCASLTPPVLAVVFDGLAALSGLAVAHTWVMTLCRTDAPTARIRR